MFVSEILLNYDDTFIKGHNFRRCMSFEVVNAFGQEKSVGKYGCVAHCLTYMDLVIFDELG